MLLIIGGVEINPGPIDKQNEMEYTNANDGNKKVYDKIAEKARKAEYY